MNLPKEFKTLSEQQNYEMMAIEQQKDIEKQRRKIRSQEKELKKLRGKKK